MGTKPIVKILGWDTSNNGDVACETYGYRDKKGIIHITDIKYSKPSSKEPKYDHHT